MRIRQWARRAVAAVVVVAIFATAAFAYYWVNAPVYPYGWSHCCDKALMIALITYADQHDGWFPRGEATPEASLSLLYREDPKSVDANLLRGKTVPESAAITRLNAGELLTAETCGWHYVEGLRKDDDARLALFWDKVGLGHNGEQLRGGGHWVCFVGSSIEHIPEAQWEAFLAEQERLRAAVKRER